jgi:hypothetical protein
MFPPGRGKLASRPVQLWVFHQAENGLTTLPVLRYRFNHRNRKCRLKNLSYWNKEAVDLAVAVSRLRQLKQSEADPKVFINGDATAHFGDIVAVLDEARKVGITKVAIETANKK